MVKAEHDNLSGLHGEEERLRAESLALIEKNESLKDHYKLVAEAMNLVFAFTNQHQHGSDDELTIQLLGIRLFNAAAVSVKLALAGYYQKAFVHVRDIIETYFLVDYLRSNPAKISEWKVADKKTRITQFGPGKIRTELDKRDGYTSGARKAIYDLISEHASHATYRGFGLTAPEGLGKLGPFVNEKMLTAWLEEMAKRFAHAAVILVADYEGIDRELEVTRVGYLAAYHRWIAKHTAGPEIDQLKQSPHFMGHEGK